ncbi:MAG: cytochrome C biogenesis protein [Alteromonadaceae bacterium]|nr:MAG: cytochrome C biogenesis protein [Alteromonadaceae bacterium]
MLITKTLSTKVLANLLTLFVSIALLYSTLVHNAYADSANVLGQTQSSNSSTSLFAEENKPAFLQVEEAYQVTPSQQSDTLTFSWFIADGYYLYQHQFKAIARNSEQVQKLSLKMPEGKNKYDDYFEKELVVYYHSAKVLSDLPKFTAPYELKVTSQGCADAGLCYPPRHQYFKVDTDGGMQEIAASVYTGSPAAPTDTGTGTQDNTSTTPPQAEPNAPKKDPFIPFVILGAILGGLILNLMPCVFPVLSLKALSFTSSHLDTRSQRMHGWAYTAGAVGSFLVAGLVILIARETGQVLGWGFQLQHPAFIAAMAYLFFVMGLSLSGLISFGGGWMGAGQSLTSGQGMKSSFFTGVLAAVVASPCTAPFMATALGVALTQPLLIALSIFVALGFGMALPFLLLSYSPALARYMPRPGAWMDNLKQFLAFPLYITCVWLLWVLANQATSDGAMTVVLGMVFISFAVWLLPLSSGKTSTGIAGKAIALSALVFSAYLAFTVSDYAKPKTDMWDSYSESKLTQLRAQGKPTFIDLTADWCLTCKINERVALNTQAVQEFVANNDITMLQGDWTNANPAITDLLAKYGRNGVPLYLMYPADPAKPATILPQLLTKTQVLEAMAAAL